MTTPFKVTEQKSVVVTVDRIDVLIPVRYEGSGCLVVEEEIMTLGIFEYSTNGGPGKGYVLPALITMVPSDTETVRGSDDEPYIKATFYKGDVFMKSTGIVRIPFLSYVLFYLFYFLGKVPWFIEYESLATLFDTVAKIHGINFGINRVGFSMVAAMLARDSKDPSIPYRHTAMKRPPIYIPLRSSYALANSVMAKLSGGYMNDAILDAMVNANDVPSDTEELLRA